MKTYHFTTNIRCEACEAKVAQAFAGESRIERFKVDLKNPDRPLEVKAEDSLSQQEVISLLREAGYQAKPKGGLLASLFGK